jgi:tryptophan-rich sensory protein
VSTQVRKYLAVAAWIGVSQLAGLIGQTLSGSSMKDWYPTVKKPSYNPPSWVFAPVWITLYTVMGIAAFLVWRKRETQRFARLGIALFGVQLVLNSLWTGAFFGLRSPGAGLAVISALWLALVGTLAAFAAVSTGAGLLLVPYLLWVSFAAVLNFSIFRLND